MSSTQQPSSSATPTNCAYGFCGDSCLESSDSICCMGSNSGNSSGTVQCGNGWFCSQTPGRCCPAANQEYCSGADQCIDTALGQSCCGPTWCPQNQTCASSSDRCCPNTQTVCATDWWLIPVSTSVTIISMTTTPSSSPTLTSHSSTPSSSSQTGTTATSTPSSNNGLSTGAKAGIGAGAAIVGIAAFVGLMLLFLKRRHSRTRPSYAAARTSEHETTDAYDFGTPEQHTPLSNYRSDQRENGTHATSTSLLHPEPIPPDYEEPDDHLYNLHAPSGAMLPRN